VVIGGRTSALEQVPAVSLYDTESCEWKNINPLPRFRHSAWAHEYSVLVFGGFEIKSPTTCVSNFMQLDLTPYILPTIEALKRSEGQKVNENIVGLRKPSEDAKIHKAKSKEETGVNFKVTPYALIAMSYSPDVPNEIQRMVITLPLIKLREESKKLVPNSQILMMNPQQPNKDGMNKNIPNMVITQLLRPKDWSVVFTEKRFFFKTDIIIELIHECQAVVESQPIICRATPPVKIFGDFHGQYIDMMRFFDLWRCPLDSSMGGDIDAYDYIFLGDYVDRGSHSLEVICLLMALKVKYPNQIHLLRGNHEDHSINLSFGFAEECAERLGEDIKEPDSVFASLNSFFDWLPLAATIDDRILCLHGGIGCSINTVEDIGRMQRPLEVVHEVTNLEQQMLIDILWSDPTENDQEVGVKINTTRDPTQSGSIVNFGPDRVEQFLKANKLELIVRGHECVMDGIERFAKGQLITVFSATDYCGRYKNAGACLFVQKNYEIVPKLIYPMDITSQSPWLGDEKRPATPPKGKGSGNLDASFI
jgi:diadenosine tetraphosphatase ApaH/serine/threonine PP2A family protein phosphatase